MIKYIKFLLIIFICFSKSTQLCNVSTNLASLVGGFRSSTASLNYLANGDFFLIGTLTYANAANPPSDVAVIKYKSNGMLDTSFGGTGYTTTQFSTNPSLNQNIAVDSIIQPDGKLVVGTSILAQSMSPTITVYRPHFGAIRYNTDGSLDTSFGTMGIVVVSSFTNLFADDLKSMALQSDGKIVLFGKDGWNAAFVLARLNVNGSLDSTFGTEGKVFGPKFGSFQTFPADMMIQTDGKILTVGMTTIVLDSNPLSFKSKQVPTLIRFLSNGTLDLSWNGTGSVTFDIPSVQFDYPRLALQSNGKSIVVGRSTTDPMRQQTKLFLARFNIDSTLDISWNGTGIIITPVGFFIDGDSVRVFVQSSGRIIVYGRSSNTGMFFINQYNANGTLNTLFGTNGTYLGKDNELDFRFSPTKMAIATNGNLFLGGTEYFFQSGILKGMFAALELLPIGSRPLNCITPPTTNAPTTAQVTTTAQTPTIAQVTTTAQTTTTTITKSPSIASYVVPFGLLLITTICI